MKCPQGTENCIKTSIRHDTCHIGWYEGRLSGTIVKYNGPVPIDGSTVAVKHDSDKYDPTMLSLELVETVSRVRMFGAKKYSRNNWKKGFKITRSLAAALRHIFAYMNGENNDPESGISHLGHAICSIEHALYDSIHNPQNDDRKE